MSLNISFVCLLSMTVYQSLLSFMGKHFFVLYFGIIFVIDGFSGGVKQSYKLLLERQVWFQSLKFTDRFAECFILLVQMHGVFGCVIWV